MQQDNSDNYKFIEEKVVQNKGKKVRKAFSKVIMSILCGVLFGLSAFIVLYFLRDFLTPKQREEQHVVETQQLDGSQPTDVATNPENNDDTKEKDDNDVKDDQSSETKHVISNQPVIVQNRIKGDLSDLTGIHREIGKMAETVNRSIVKVSVIEKELDWFQSPYEKRDITSGVIVKEEGPYYFIITESSKVAGKEDIRVSFNGGNDVAAELYDMQSEVGLACLRVDKGYVDDETKKNVAAIGLGESHSIFLGEPVAALGNPNGNMYSLLIGNVTDKNTGVNVTDDRMEVFCTDIKPYSDGSGIIVNMDGNLIGLITKTVAVNDEVCSALSISRLHNLIEKMTTRSPRVYLGVITTDITESMRKGLDGNSGIYVSKVETDSPAALAGIKAGDVILEMGDSTVLSTAGFATYLQSAEPGSTAVFKIARPGRDGEEVFTLEVTLGETVLK